MEKKIYFEPKEEVIILQMNSALLSGSPSGTDEGGSTPTGGGEGEDTPGGW